MLWRVSPIITGLPLSFVSNTLNEVLVEITYIQMSYLTIKIKKTCSEIVQWSQYSRVEDYIEEITFN